MPADPSASTPSGRTQPIDVIQEFCHFGPLVLLISKNIVIASYLL